MLRNEPTVTIVNGTITIVIKSIADALELQKSISHSIAMALDNGKSGRANSIPTQGEAHDVRFQVEIGKHEAFVIAFEENKKTCELQNKLYFNKELT